MRPLVVILAAGLVLSACGEAPRPANEPRVKLELELPDDGGSIRAAAVEVRGTVTPADAAVQVAGHQAPVDGGAFVVRVNLAPGGNVIDVTATVPGRRPATDALRVTRDTRVEIPVLAGQDYDTAASALTKLGLKAAEERGGTWLDRVLGAEFPVCSTTPPAKALVQPNSTVTVTTAPEC